MVRRKKLTGISFQITRGPGGIRGCRKGGRIKKNYANYFHQREGAGEYADAVGAGGEKIHANYLSSTRGNVEIRGWGKHSPCISPDPCVH